MSGFNYIIFAIMLVVFIIMVAGLVVMSVGGRTNAKYGNKLMVARVGMQALIVFMLGAMFMLSR
jgi:hypothetical protein